jgi:hypothetical protein
MIAVGTVRLPLLFRLLVGTRLRLHLALHLLHLRPLILEPDLDNSHTEASFLGERLPNLTAGLGRDLEGSLELAPLGGSQDRPRPLGSASAVARSTVVQEIVVCAQPNTASLYLFLIEY